MKLEHTKFLTKGLDRVYVYTWAKAGRRIYLSRARGTADSSQKDDTAGGPVSTVCLPPRSRDGVSG